MKRPKASKLQGDLFKGHMRLMLAGVESVADERCRVNAADCKARQSDDSGQ